MRILSSNQPKFPLDRCYHLVSQPAANMKKGCDAFAFYSSCELCEMVSTDGN